MTIFKKNPSFFIINLLVIIFLFVLPYYLFVGKLFIGGDDTRLYYVYPLEFLKSISWFSWYNFSSVGSYNPNQFSVPFTAIWSIIYLIVRSRMILDYLSFSLPLILGFIYFQKLVKEFFDNNKYKWEILLGSLIYITSPIVIYNQLSIFLYAAWLIALIPIVSYYFIAYYKTNNFVNIFKAMLYCIFFSFALYAIPWFLGFLFPICISLIFSLYLYEKETVFAFIKRAFIFCFFLLLSQFFWLLPFALTFINSGSSSYGGQILSQGTANSFAGTVLSTATGSIFFPLLNLFHRQMAFDYNWDLKNVFLSVYDPLLFINLIYIVLLFLGIFFVKQVFKKDKLSLYTTVLVAFLISLFLFTVNIGPLKQVFLWFGVVPGFAMFRNFYDKFALGYALIYSILLTISLIVANERFPTKKRLITGSLIFILLINVISAKNVIVRELWTTTNIFLNITIPDEYLRFMQNVKQTIPASSNILSLPFNIASYTFIKDPSSNNVYAGTSPVKIFSGINDYSGNLSFTSDDSQRMNQYIKYQEYKNVLQLLQEHNINYVFLTKNVPSQVKQSYLFKDMMINNQENAFVNAVTQRKILSSADGNYDIYQVKNPQNIFNAKNITFTKVNQATYLIYIHHLKNNEQIAFLDSYQSGWKLYPVKNPTLSWCSKKYILSPAECVTENKLFVGNELSLLFMQPIFNETHKPYKNFGNQWQISQSALMQQYSNEYYRKNADGSIDVMLELYFVPQTNFYIGALISGATVLGFIIYLFIVTINSKKVYE